MFITSPQNIQAGYNLLQVVILVFICTVIGSIVLLAYSNARSAARDAKRVSDVAQLQLALKYFHQEYGYYPLSGSSFQPVTFDNTFYKIIDVWPNAPVPSDGLCTDSDNVYAYEQIDRESYSIKFCLGNDYGNLKSGLRIVTPTGIQ